MRKLPVFYHVPKCAGTYAYNLMWELVRIYSGAAYDPELANTVCNIEIKENNKTYLRIIAYDKNFFCKKENTCFNNTNGKNHYILNYKDIEQLKNLTVFSVIIESEGFRVHHRLLKQFEKFELKKFIFLREPFSKNKSLYYYLSQDESIHEPTHNLYNVDSFSEYLKTHYVEDSWVIRTLLNLNDNQIITEKEYQETIDILKDFIIYDYKLVETIINDIFLDCYDLSIHQINVSSYEKLQEKTNKCNTDNFILNDFDLTTQNFFLERTYWDMQLYNHFIKK